MSAKNVPYKPNAMSDKQYVTSEVKFFTEEKLKQMRIQIYDRKLQQTDIDRLIEFLNAVRRLSPEDYEELTYNEVHIRDPAERALRIIGFGVDCETVLAQFFGFDQDNDLVGLAFHYLVSQWGHSTLYADQIRRYVWGGEFDPDRDAGFRALKAAGEYLSQTNCQDRRLLRKLLLISTASEPADYKTEFYDDEQILSSDIEKEIPYSDFDIECAIAALSWATHDKRWNRMEPKERHVDMSDEEVLFEKVRQILASPDDASDADLSAESLIKEIDLVKAGHPAVLNAQLAAKTLKEMIDQGYEDNGIEDPVLARHLLMFVGIVGGTKYSDLISECLASTRHLEIARTALTIISEEWNQTENFLDDIYALLLGVPWDPSGYLRYQAVKAVSNMSRDHDDWPKIREILTQISEEKDADFPDMSQRAISVLQH